MVASGRLEGLWLGVADWVPGGSVGAGLGAGVVVDDGLGDKPLTALPGCVLAAATAAGLLCGAGVGDGVAGGAGAGVGAGVWGAGEGVAAGFGVGVGDFGFFCVF